MSLAATSRSGLRMLKTTERSLALVPAEVLNAAGADDQGKCAGPKLIGYDGLYYKYYDGVWVVTELWALEDEQTKGI